TPIGGGDELVIYADAREEAARVMLEGDGRAMIADASGVNASRPRAILFTEPEIERRRLDAKPPPTTALPGDAVAQMHAVESADIDEIAVGFEIEKNIEQRILALLGEIFRDVCRRCDSFPQTIISLGRKREEGVQGQRPLDGFECVRAVAEGVERHA